jgi:hypothetical protein
MEHDPPIELTVGPGQNAGVWANWANVAYNANEFQLDFVRLDVSERPSTRGVLVARVALSPRFTMDLMDMLQLRWQSYAKETLPKEVYDDGEAPEDDVPDR